MLPKHHLAMLIGLAVTWCLLSGHYTGLLLSLGGLSCLFSYSFYQKIVRETKITRIKFHPLKQFRYTLWLLGEIIKSSIEVMGAILNPKKLSPQFFEVEVGDLDELGQVIYANSITLTPGTVSIEVKPTEIRVHALLISSKDGLLANKMRTKVRQLAIDR